MKVLYISPYRTGSDYTDAATNYILALDAVGVDVVPRCVYSQNVNVPDRITELEKKSSEGCDTLVIHGPPAHFEHYKDFKKCIGITCIETDQFRISTWNNKLNLMDKIIVANQQAKKACEDSFVTTPVHVLPYAFDVNKIKSYNPLPEIANRNKDFLFYFIARSNKRKNIIEILRAFHSEFRFEEPVNLLIKTGAPNLAVEITRNDIRKISDTVKRDLRLYPVDGYKTELVVTEWLTPENLASLHNTCNCYIGVGSNENWCIPAFDAMAYGKTPIFMPYAGYDEYLSEDNGFPTEYNLDNCFGFIGNSEVYTADEVWAKPNIKDLRAAMRYAYNIHTNDKVTLEKMQENGIDTAYEHSYENVGTKLKELLLDE